MLSFSSSRLYVDRGHRIVSFLFTHRAWRFPRCRSAIFGGLRRRIPLRGPDGTLVFLQVPKAAKPLSCPVVQASCTKLVTTSCPASELSARRIRIRATFQRNSES